MPAENQDKYKINGLYEGKLVKFSGSNLSSRIVLFVSIFVALILALYFSYLIFEKKELLNQEYNVKAWLDLSDLDQGLQKYKKLNKVFPNKLEGLSALFQSEALSFPPQGYFRNSKEEPYDPWGNFYEYEVYDKELKFNYIIKSLGEDGVVSLDDIIFLPLKSFNREDIEDKLFKLNKEIFYNHIRIISVLSLLFLLIVKVLFDIFRRRKGDRNRANKIYNIFKAAEVLSDSKYQRDKLYDVTLLLGQVYSALRCSFVRFVSATEAIVLASSDKKSSEEIRINLKNYPELEKVFKEQKMLIQTNLTKDPLLKPIINKLKHKKYAQMLTIPVFSRNEHHSYVKGAVLLRTGKGSKGFSEEDIFLCNILARFSSKNL